MPELLDEIDEQDIPTGRSITKQQAHEERLLHRCSVVYLSDKKKVLYLQVHKKSNNRLDHAAGGHVQRGESYLEAAKRELREELGLEIKLDEIKAHFLSEERSARHMYAIYIGTAPDTWQFKPNKEVEKLVKTTLSDLTKTIAEHSEHYTSGLINTLPIVQHCLQATK